MGTIVKYPVENPVEQFLKKEEEKKRFIDYDSLLYVLGQSHQTTLDQMVPHSNLVLACAMMVLVLILTLCKMSCLVS